jgi:hypothetical protein
VDQKTGSTPLRRRSVKTYFQSPDQLVVSHQNRPVLPSGGNSFWVTRQLGAWYLCTWAPNYYRLSPEADIVSLCEEFVDFGSIAEPEVPASIIQQFGLSKLSDEEAAETFGTAE